MLYNPFSASETENVQEGSYMRELEKDIVFFIITIASICFVVCMFIYDDASTHAVEPRVHEQFTTSPKDIAGSSILEQQIASKWSTWFIEERTIRYNEALEAANAEYANDFKRAGIVYDENGTRFTWYSQNVLPGGGLTALNNNGRHVGENGFIYDGDGYIAVASDDTPQGEIVDTPWGKGKVYDSGNGSGNGYDVYTNF